MKINGKSIQGTYVYSENETYEVGDLVLYENGLYIYTKSDEGPYGLDKTNPKDSKDYTPYLGDKLTSLEDWKAFLNGESEDKYITTSTLVAILNTCMNDMRLDGIIESAYDEPQDESPKGWILDEYRLDTEIADNAIIDEILRSSSNYAIYRVSRKLQGLWMVNYDTSSVIDGNYTEEDKSSVLMKQYTYYSSEEDKEQGIQTRIQELIDYVDGTVYYRYAKYDPVLEKNGTLGNLTSVSNWHSTRISKEYELQVNAILTAYSSKIKELQLLEKNLKKNFKFKSLDIVPGQSSVLLSLVGSPGSVKLDRDFNEIGPITIILKEKLVTTDVFYRSHEVTIEYIDGTNRSKYLLGDNTYITVSTNYVGDLKIETSSKDITIQTMYYKEFY